MGFDKPDLGFVVHFQSPGSPVAYYQQVGRAGRTNDGANGILLRGKEDQRIHEYFISSAFPKEQQINAWMAIAIGIAQGLAITPGISRSGATIMGGILLKIQRKDIVEFSFFMAIPVILGATVFDLWQNFVKK